MHEADELLEKIINLIEEEGCEITKSDNRHKRHGTDWSLDLRVVIKPISGEEI